VNTLIDSDVFKVSSLLEVIADQYTDEAGHWASDEVSYEILEQRDLVRAAARHTLTQGVDYGESFAHAARLQLSKYIGLRKFIEHCVRGTGPGYITLDCRDGRHLGCDTCGCWCHK
jgi:hypothetical protein